MVNPKVLLFVRSLFFVILKPVVVIGLVPFIITGDSFSDSFSNHFTLHHYIGLLIFLVGVIILFHCVVRFAIDGLGTLSPIDPTKRLVISGLYKYTRNPMYIGVILILFGETVFTKSIHLLFYSFIIIILFYLFVVYKEEPRLKKDFGQNYEMYCNTVNRWF